MDNQTKITKAYNLHTGVQLTYINIDPAKAVMFAHLASTGRNNTFEYEQLYKENMNKLIFGKKTVAMGDWCSLLKPDNAPHLTSKNGTRI